MKKIFDEINDLRQVINDIDDEKYKNVLSTNVAYKISSEELNNINAIRKFERVLGKEFLN